MPPLDELKREPRLICSLAATWFRRRWRKLVLCQGLLLLLIWAGLHPFDHGLLQAVRGNPLGLNPGTTLKLAEWLSKWGDFPGLNLVLALVLWLIGWAARKPKWRRLAVMTLLCAAMAGIATNLIRCSLGRARPYSKKADAFYGPRFTHEFQSTPSGHTTTAFAAAIPLLIAAPPLGIATTVAAGGVAWSRMYLNRHYPADIATGLWMALWFGVPFGFAARVRRAVDS